MKELTAHQLETLTKSVFVRFNKIGDFKVLRGFNGETFLDYGQAMEFCCEHYDNVTIEIAEYKDALEGEGQQIKTKQNK
jgi:hypothetical protein